MKSDKDTVMRQAPDAAKVYLIEAQQTVRKMVRLDTATTIIVVALADATNA